MSRAENGQRNHAYEQDAYSNSKPALLTRQAAGGNYLYGKNPKLVRCTFVPLWFGRPCRGVS